MLPELENPLVADITIGSALMTSLTLVKFSVIDLDGTAKQISSLSKASFEGATTETFSCRVTPESLD